MRRLPPLRSLEAFTRTVRLGSARAAAEELALSPSALSRRIATLEEFTGKRLFSRQKQAMKLTDEGEAFYRAVSPRIDALADAIDGQVEDGRLHRLHLGVMPLFGSQRLFPRLAELRKRHPQLHIDIDTSPHLEARVGDTLDAAIMLTEAPDAALYSVRLDHNRVFAIADRSTVAEVGDTPDAERLARQTFLVHNELAESFNAWRDEIGLPELQPAAIDHFDSGQLILEAAAQGLGIAIMHDDHLARAKDERLAALFPDIEVESPFSYWFVCRPGALETRAVRQFHDWLVGAGL
jgi:LysR family glycine cleavage system transcriptional activator